MKYLKWLQVRSLLKCWIKNWPNTAPVKVGRNYLCMFVELCTCTRFCVGSSSQDSHDSNPSTDNSRKRKASTTNCSPQNRGETSTASSCIVIGSPLKSQKKATHTREISKASESSTEAKRTKAPTKKKADKKVSNDCPMTLWLYCCIRHCSWKVGNKKAIHIHLW